MTIMKTHKAAAKRVWRTKNDKFMHRKSGQDHFNARENGNTGTNKRRDVVMSRRTSRTIGRMLLG